MMTSQEFPHAERAERVAAVRQWWLDHASEGYGSMSGARACAAHFGACRNTIRGLQYEAFKGEAAPWLASPAAAAVAAASAALPMPLADMIAFTEASRRAREDLDFTAANERHADATKAREAARQPRPPKPPKHKKRYTIDDDGLFQPARPGEPLHICPACKRTAADHAELSLGWGLRTDKRSGRVSPQSRCYKCRTAHRQELRELRKLQLDIVPTPATCSVAGAMRQGEADEIAQRAAAALRNGSAVVELEVKDDPRVALALDVEVVSAGLYPLCPGGPLGAIVGCDPESDTGILRLRFDARALRDWAVSQGATLITAAPATEQAHAAYQDPPGLSGLLGGRL